MFRPRRGLRLSGLKPHKASGRCPERMMRAFLRSRPFVRPASFSYRSKCCDIKQRAFLNQKGSSMTWKQENIRSTELDEAVCLFGEAWAGGDIAKLEELLSSSYTHIDYFGEFHDRAGWLDYARRRTRLKTRISFRDLRTRVSVMSQLSLAQTTSITLATPERALKAGAFDSRRFGCGREGAGCGRHSKPQRFR